METDRNNVPIVMYVRKVVEEDLLHIDRGVEKL